MVHDDGPRVNWRLAVVTRLIVGGDGLLGGGGLSSCKRAK